MGTRIVLAAMVPESRELLSYPDANFQEKTSKNETCSMKQQLSVCRANCRVPSSLANSRVNRASEDATLAWLGLLGLSRPPMWLRRRVLNDAIPEMRWGCGL